MAANDTTPTPTNGNDTWFVREGEETIHGPLPFGTLYDWACRNRLAATSPVSTDRETWTPAKALPALKMHWTASTQDGQPLGPFNLSAVPYLAEQGLLSPDAMVKSLVSGRSLAARSLLNLGDEPTLTSRETPASEDAAHNDHATLSELSETARETQHALSELRELLALDDDTQILPAVVELKRQATDSSQVQDELQQDIDSAQRTVSSLREEQAEDRESYSSRIDDLARQLNDAKRELGQARASAASMKKEIAEVQCRQSLSHKRQAERVTVLEDQAAALDAKARAMKKERDEALQLLSDQNQQLTDIEILEATLTARNQEVEKQRAEHQAMVGRHREALEQARTGINTVRHEAENARQALAQQRQHHETAIDEQRQQHEKGVTALQARVHTLEDAIERSESRVEELEDTVQTLIGTRNELAERAATLEQERKAAEKSLAAATQRLSDQNTLLAQRDSTLAEQQSRLSLQETRLAEQDAHLHDQQARLTDQSNRLADQSKRFVEHERVRGELDSSSRALERIRLEYEERRRTDAEALATLREDADALHARLAEASDEQESLRSATALKEAELTRLRAEVAEKSRQFGELTASVDDGDARQRSLRAELDRVASERDRAQAHAKALDTQIAETANVVSRQRDLQVKLHALQRERDIALAQIDELRERSGQSVHLAAETASLTTEIESLRSRMSTELADHHQREAKLTAEIAALRSMPPPPLPPPVVDTEAVQSLEKQLRARESALREVQVSLRTVTEQRDQLAQRVSGLGKELESARVSVAEPRAAEEELEKLETDLRAREESLTQLRTEHESMLASRSDTYAHTQEEIRRLRDEVERANGECFDLRETNVRLQARVNRLTTPIAEEGMSRESLQRMLRELTAERDGLIQELAVSRKEYETLTAEAEVKEEELAAKVRHFESSYQQAIDHINATEQPVKSLRTPALA